MPGTWTAEHKRKISQALTGKHLSKSAKEKISIYRKTLTGSKNPFFAKKHSDETKRRISETKRKNPCRYWKGKQKPFFQGKNNPRWKDGISNIKTKIRKCFKYVEWRQNVLQRDDFTCQKCRRRGGKLEAHHVKSFHELMQEAFYNLPLLDKYEACIAFSPLWDVGNGETLCKDCHDETKQGRR